MEDTPDHIKKLQLQIWLSKTPAERLRQFLIDNDTLMQFWKNARAGVVDLSTTLPTSDESPTRIQDDHS